MDYLKKNRIVFWVLIFLVVVNLTALATYYVNMRKPVAEPVSIPAAQKGAAIGKELSLTAEQSARVSEINDRYRKTSEPIVQAIRERKAALLDELSKDVSDSLKLVSLAEEVSIEQKKLQEANIQQFLDLKHVCTPEQTQKLSQIYGELYGCERKGQGRGRGGQGQGQGHRHRYGWQAQDTTGGSR